MLKGNGDGDSKEKEIKDKGIQEIIKIISMALKSMTQKLIRSESWLKTDIKKDLLKKKITRQK